MNKTGFRLPENWSQFTLGNKKALYYNMSDQLISFHPPFPIQNFLDFINFYNLECNITEITKQIEAMQNKTQCKQHKQNNQTNLNSKPKQRFTIEHINNFSITTETQQINFTPITNFNQLSDLLEISKVEPIENILKQVCNIKLGLMPSFKYNSCSSNINTNTTNNNNTSITKKTCSLLLNSKAIFISDPNMTKEESKYNVINKALKAIIPSIYPQILYQFKNPSKNIQDTPQLNGTKNIKSLISYVDEQRQYFLGNHSSIIKNSETIVSFTSELNCNYCDFLIDDPIIIDIYLNCLTYDPLKMVKIIQLQYQNIDITIEAYNKNPLNEIDKLKNVSETYVIIKSKMLGMQGEAMDNNKVVALQYSAQRFLKKLYEGQFEKWIALTQFFIENPKEYLQHLCL